jgi:cytochrome oxidase assembly protein ShyY1
MKAKKVLFTVISVPIAHKTWWAYHWQRDRKLEKQQEIKERTDKIRMPVLDIEDVTLIDCTDSEEFMRRWQYRPVRVKGVLDNEQEITI